MKKILCGLVALSMSVSMFAGCNQSSPTPSSSGDTVPSSTVPSSTVDSVSKDDKPSTDAAVSADALEGPFVVTTCGQSPGAVMVNMVAMQSNLTSMVDNVLTADALETQGNKTLIVTTGTSMKGMGAAGTDVNAEITRCTEVVKKAKEAGMVIVAAHVEGMARRTDSSDANSIDSMLALCDVILVIDDSDSDGYFTKYASDNNKPLIKVKDALSISSVLK